MRKGEVFVTVEHKRKTDPVIVTTVFTIGGIIFLVLAIAVSAAMVQSANPKMCAPTNWLRRDEQTICRPSSKDDFLAKVDPTATSMVKYYRLNREHLSNSVVKTHKWSDTVDLSKGAYAFPMTSSSRLKFTMNVICTKGKCESVKMYWLYRDYFDKANAGNTFDEDMYSWRFRDFSTPQILSEALESADLYYLVFANQGQESTLVYNMTIEYTVFSMKEEDAVACTKDTCSFENVATDEVIVMNYIDREEKGPSYISAEIKTVQKSVAGAIFFAILFTILAVGCFVIAILFVLQRLGKLNLYKKMPIPRSSGGSDGGKYEAPEIAGDRATKVSAGGNEEL